MKQMSCNNLTSVELKKILVAADVKGRSKYTTKVEMCKVIQKLGLLLPGTTSKVRSIKSSKTAVSSKKSHAKSNKVAIKTISKKLRTKEAARNRKVLTGLGDDKDNEAIWAKAAEAYKMKFQKAKEAKKEHELNLQKSKQAEEAKKEKELELQTAREEAEEEMKLKKKKKKM